DLARGQRSPMVTDQIPTVAVDRDGNDGIRESLAVPVQIKDRVQKRVAEGVPVERPVGISDVEALFEKLCVTHIWIWMRGSCERLKESPGEDHVVETAEAAPESHDARLAVTGACEEAAELSDHAHRLANGGWFGWGGTVGVMDSEQHPPGIIVQDDRGGHVRGGAGPVGGLQQPSGDHGVDDRRPPQAI